MQNSPLLMSLYINLLSPISLNLATTSLPKGWRTIMVYVRQLTHSPYLATHLNYSGWRCRKPSHATVLLVAEFVLWSNNVYFELHLVYNNIDCPRTPPSSIHVLCCRTIFLLQDAEFSLDGSQDLLFNGIVGWHATRYR